MQSGSMIGVTTADGNERYAGIRYATARRFEAPVLAPSWDDEYDATEFGAACCQPPVFVPLVPGGDLGVATSEDCHFLNVWVPKGTGPFPVLVWIHGGAFLTGAASQAMYDADHLATAGNVVVSINYRVGPLGFVDLRALPEAPPGWVANAGLLDIECALRWTRMHISGFNGDANAVTVVGESAGGGSILHLLGGRDRAELFDRAVIQSGSAGRTFSPEVAAMIGERFCAGVGVSAREIASVDVTRLVAAIGPTMGDPAVFGVAGMMPFHPAIDGSFVVESPLAALDAGAHRGCDLLFGVNRDEMTLFLEAATVEPEQLARRIAKYLDTDVEVASDLVERYTKQLAIEGLRNDPIDAWGAIYSDHEMTLPIRSMLDRAARHHERSFGYLFTWEAPARPDGRPLGAAHGIDLPFTFATFDIDGWRGFVGAESAEQSKRADEASVAMRTAITRFAATGDPGWPSWSHEQAMYEFGAAMGIRHDPLIGRVGLWA